MMETQGTETLLAEYVRETLALCADEGAPQDWVDTCDQIVFELQAAMAEERATAKQVVAVAQLHKRLFEVIMGMGKAHETTYTRRHEIYPLLIELLQGIKDSTLALYVAGDFIAIIKVLCK